MKNAYRFTLILFIFMTITELTEAQDWPNLARYRADNAKINSTADENRVVFMGNSITEGWVREMPAFFADNPFIGRGISGQTTPQMLLRFRQDVIALKPKVVMILAGTNDIAGNTGPATLEMIEDNIYSMAELANLHGIMPVLCSVLPVFDYPWRPGLHPAEKIVELNKRLETYACTHGFVYCNYFSAMADERNGMQTAYSEDGVHPNKKGYEVMAPIAKKAIVQALLTQQHR